MKERVFRQAVFTLFNQTRHTASDDELYYLIYKDEEWRNGFDPSIMKSAALSRVSAIKWARNGFPTVRLTPQQTAAFCLTDVSETQAQLIKLPWSGFEIIPADMMTPEGLLNRITVAELLVPTFLCDTGTMHDSVLRNTIQISVYWGHGLSTAKLYADITDFATQASEGFGGPRNWKNFTTRWGNMSAKIVANVLLALHEKRGIRVPYQNNRQPKSKRNAKRNARHQYIGLEYKLSTPVRVDQRRVVHDYLSGKTDRLYLSRWLVRGHWRNQACGPGLSMRKLKFVEPYWKGPERGAVLIRDHLIEDGHRTTDANRWRDRKG